MFTGNKEKKKQFWSINSYNCVITISNYLSGKLFYKKIYGNLPLQMLFSFMQCQGNLWNSFMNRIKVLINYVYLQTCKRGVSCTIVIAEIKNPNYILKVAI